jgi:hypothetical protein
LDFAKGAYTASGGLYTGAASIPGYSFTRASGGYAENVDGSLTYFASGIPRITNKGYLSEEARTNLVLQSQAFDNASWNKVGITATADQASAPDGTTTADLLTNTAAASYLNQSPATLTGGTNYTVTRWVKATVSTPARYFTIGFFGQPDAYFDIQTGTTASSGTGIGFVSATATQASNGWWKLSATWTKDATVVTDRIFLAFASSLTSQVITGTVTAYSWGAQLEAGAFATSYIPTTTAAATRAADGFYIAGNFMGSGPWTWLTDASINLSAISSPTVGGFRKDFSNYLVVYVNGTAGLVNLNLKVAGSDVWNVQKSAFASGSAKIAMSLIGGNVYQSINGGAAGSLGVNSVFAPTQVIIGWGGSANQLNGYTRSVTIWNNEFSTAQLQAITA